MFTAVRIKHKLYIGFAAILALILLLLALAYSNFLRLSEANGWDRHTLEVLREADKVNVVALEIQVNQRGYLLGGDERLRDSAANEAALRRHLERLRALTADNPLQQQRLAKLAQWYDGWIAEVVHPLIARRQSADQGGAALDLSKIAPLIQNGFRRVGAIEALLGEVGAEEGKLLAERARQSLRLQQNMQLTLSAGGLLCVALALLVAWLLARAILAPLARLSRVLGELAGGRRGARVEVRGNDEFDIVGRELNRMAQAIEDNLAREQAAGEELRGKVDALLAVVSKAAAGDLTGRVDGAGDDAIGRLGGGVAGMLDNLRGLIDNVQKAGIQVTTSATEIAASARQQEATGIEQAQTSVEVLSTTREIAANTSTLLETMQEASAVADYTTSATAGAQQQLGRMDATMQHMVAATDSINAKLAALSDKASNINGVLTTITKVADQTNILSLNAAIEAEKAGEAGRGFSVVATEIRRLADQTSVSTWDIEQMLKEMQSAVSASVMGMDKFSEEIRRSVGEVRQVGQQLSGVMDQVRKLAPQFDAVLQGMQSQAVGAAQISSTMTQLNDATQQSVDSLKATSEAVHQLQYAAGDLQASVANFAVAA
ncbi:methyl-accepting chemotaxis protein [Rugamonas sp. DEMB1]|uniref:methyl-accepting chemotaxis protein n=1 Tax=Rugamonas sp. DEMB1 TaxID=3039386 RepID=UPI002449DA94|nr:methyl-accepting chemotaxis protein [Rugamonas sp. DEMB1]WGG49055.1 methyl-accepting chemotaxis protein [Rugamonas sp. DEMB1]